MCSIVILRRPTDMWPVVVAANRDEMRDRPWLPPARHWPDRPEVTAGLDELAGGTWLGLNDAGVVAAVLNRVSTLGPAPGKRSRGELPLEALDHADAALAVEALTDLDPQAYRPFNMVVADNRDAFWLRSDGVEVKAAPLPEGVSMITAFDRNDTADPRIARHLPRFRAAAAPQPGDDQWGEWPALLASGDTAADERPTAAMCFMTERGFGTVSSSLIALPAIGAEVPPRWLFSDGPPDAAPFRPVPLRG
ncbi:NRDE family protein [Caenispirillum bisanense]|uniref:NRDE family protein n=1 Tax=Caenispirillum bisanense TaxID=414052 RepID=UPI0031DCED5D